MGVEEIPGIISDLSISTSLKNLQTDFSKIPDKPYEPLQNLSQTHIESFNFALGAGLKFAVQDLPTHSVKLKTGQKIGLRIHDVIISKPEVTNSRAVSTLLYPGECRQRGTTYASVVRLKLEWFLNDIEQDIFERYAGEIPIMVKSSWCNLKEATPKQLTIKGEEEHEFGGYFIVNGNEKLVRLLVTQKANYPMAIKRGGWAKRDKYFTDMGVSVRCVRRDGTANTNVLHYLNNGTCVLNVLLSREPMYIPVMMIIRALVAWTDREIYQEIMKGQEDNQLLKGCVLAMLRQLPADDVNTQEKARKFIGRELKGKIREGELMSDDEVALEFFDESVCIHLESPEDKVRLIGFMMRKLFAFVHGKCIAENPDSPMFQDVLTSGAVYLLVLKERLSLLTRAAILNIKKDGDRMGEKLKLSSQFISEQFGKAGSLTRPMQYFLATGNLNPKSTIHLQQTSGFAVVADKINFMRYMAHFRSIHRGAFFQEMRTTACRKLLPEAWGFLCPVHTPDGAPCGLLNHLASACKILIAPPSCKELLDLLRSFGMIDTDAVRVESLADSYTVLLDGQVVGWIPDDVVAKVVETLRFMKTQKSVPEELEVGFVPKSKYGGQSPGLYLFLASGGRFARPVRNLKSGKVEWIGPFEQVYMNIAIRPEEVVADQHTHVELTEQAFLSEVASMTPYSDHNQSPRNLYQCQMGKQSMATPVVNWPHRADNKLYRVVTPQAPLVRPAAHRYYNMDQHPMGTNAIVAVISYTGYDMEDAMIINKASFERGFGYGCIYKSENIDLREVSKATRQTYVFGVVKSHPGLNHLGSDGLPLIGTRLNRGDALYCYYDKTSLTQRIEKYDDAELAIVDSVRCLGSDGGNEHFNHVSITMRVPRPPTVGDKFASRHGQKGVCSRLYPVEDMPFTESGMTPDIIFNPHGYPSRMTIGMMIETMAGKVGALKGVSFDATPFVYGEENTAINHFGEMLKAAGYNYFGNEVMYSGVDGRQLEVNIFFGLVYYQRLRHMVSDKYQVRTNGTCDDMTGQPIKGRKRGGGTRFGEMERDALIAHGASYLLQDRLFDNSDKTTALCCKKCGNLLSPIAEPKRDPTDAQEEVRWTCKLCSDGGEIVTVELPQVFRYLVVELASCNMKLRLDLESGAFKR